MAKATILVVDDDSDIQELLDYNLVKEGYHVICADTGEQALKIAQSKLPEIVILDLLLPGIDGLEVCRRLKSDIKTKSIPIVMLTAKGEETDIIVGIELGADEYIIKPFSPKLLIARIRKVLRKKDEQKLDRTILRIHDLTIDPARYKVLIKTNPVDLTLSEFNILYTLAQRPGLVFTRYQIADAIHGINYIVSDRAIDVQIAFLRKKLGHRKDYIETVRGVGYRFKDGQS
jgi:two-component system phosphate regulon response regulator PhoB